jgi:hypothetical protein
MALAAVEEFCDLKTIISFRGYKKLLKKYLEPFESAAAILAILDPANHLEYARVYLSKPDYP